MKKNLQFVCTGNYYRSRFAEEYFNHLAVKHNLYWEATSKGLSENMPSLNNPGPISEHTLEALTKRGIEGIGTDRYPQPMQNSDFRKNHLIIAMSKLEHRPMLESRFKAYCDKVEYFEVGDLPVEDPKQAISKIANLVDELVNRMTVNKEIAGS